MIMMTSLVAAGVSVCLGAGACLRVPPVAPDEAGRIQPTRAPLGGEFSLRDGEAAVVGENDLLVRFERVSSDARCSVGSTCRDDGDAVVVVSLRQPPDAPAMVELHTGEGQAKEVEYVRYRVRLVRLEPRPVGEQFVPLPHYVATLTVLEKSR